MRYAHTMPKLLPGAYATVKNRAVSCITKSRQLGISRLCVIVIVVAAVPIIRLVGGFHVFYGRFLCYIPDTLLIRVQRSGHFVSLQGSCLAGETPLVFHLRYASQVPQIRPQHLNPPGNYRPLSLIRSCSHNSSTHFFAP